VSGLIDFGNLRVDSPLTDLARLLGSLAADDPQTWLLGLRAYRQELQVSEEDVAVIRLLDRTSVVLSSVNWIRWLFLEDCEFPSWPLVQLRLQNLLIRLQRMVAHQ
jgi:Ser/Thr protein kinase RdoA (MazF antagonist)